MQDKQIAPITDREYWSGYYGTRRVNTDSVISICSQYDEFWDRAIANVDPPVKNIIEIGGFPGRYVAYLGWKYQLVPTSLDFNPDTGQIKEHFEAFNLQDYSILKEDFFSYEPKREYDIVLSNGFVEHFGDHDSVLDLHVKYVRDGGVLIVTVPNMRGLVRPYKLFLDKENLSKHSLACMKLSVFHNFARRNNLQILHLGYFGGFPHGVHEQLSGIKDMTQRLSRLFFKYGVDRFVSKYPNRFFSSLIIGVFKKKCVVSSGPSVT